MVGEGEKMSRGNNRKRYINRSNKKRKLNKQKIIILVLMIGVFSFGMGKVTKGVSGFIKGIGSKNVSAQESQSEGKQFDLDSEISKVDKKYTILVDAGHGGNDIGTEGYGNSQDKSDKNNVYEKDIALKIAKKVTSKLSKHKDVQVIMSRTEDKYMSLLDRIDFANSQDVDLLVSVHLNAETGGNSASGLETYHRRNPVDDSDKLAEIVQKTIVSYIDVRDRGVREENYDVIKAVKMPAILVECGFLTNPEEEKKLLTDKYQDQLADGITQGVLSYLDGKE